MKENEVVVCSYNSDILVTISYENVKENEVVVCSYNSDILVAIPYENVTAANENVTHCMNWKTPRTFDQGQVSINMQQVLFFVCKTAFTRCRYILKTVKNVTAAKFELAFTRYRNNLKTVGT